MRYLNGGTIVRIDLTSGKVRRENSKPYTDKWLGGRGINARIVFEETGPDTNPLGPENVLVFSVGPLTGTMAPGCGRVEVGARSPASGLQAMSNMGGYWGPALKYAGIDSLVIKGIADKPVYLAIKNDQVEIREAGHLWGLDAFQATDAIKGELRDPETEVVAIGQAGENLVSYASLQTRAGNAAGRTGIGTVMGSKKLKAIAVRGTKGVQLAQPERFFQLCHNAFERQKPLVANAKTLDLIDNDPPTWALTLGNYESTLWEQRPRRGHRLFWEAHKNPQGEGIIGCFNCQVRCMDYYWVKNKGAALASCNVYASTNWVMRLADMDGWYQFTVNCQRQGLDAMSAARMIAWAMSLYEKGFITDKDTGGIALEWGSTDAILQILDQIVHRRGLGDILANSPEQAAEKLGGVEPPLNIKNIPLGGTNVMNFRARTIGAAVNPRGGDEYRVRFGSFDNLGTGKNAGMTGMATPDAWEAKEAMRIVREVQERLRKEGKRQEITQFDYDARGQIAALGHKLIAVTDSLVQCKWNTTFLNVGLGIELQSELLSAGWGKEVSIDDLLTVGWRTICQERAYALRLGLTPEKDTVPKRFFEHPMGGTWPEDVLDINGVEQMKREYYQSLGWDPATGVPTSETLAGLSLDDVAEKIKAE